MHRKGVNKNIQVQSLLFLWVNCPLRARSTLHPHALHLHSRNVIFDGAVGRAVGRAVGGAGARVGTEQVLEHLGGASARGAMVG